MGCNCYIMIVKQEPEDMNLKPLHVVMGEVELKKSITKGTVERGDAFNFPMSTITIIEDALMTGMSAVMLLTKL